jgi:RHS repeat-associated protein
MTEKRSRTANSDGRRLGDPLDYEQDYAYAAGHAHRAERIGKRHYQYDLNGNVTVEQDGPFATTTPGDFTVTELENGTRVVNNGWGLNDNGTTTPTPKVWKREYRWNERNLLRTSSDGRYIVEYAYGQDGERSGKYSMTSDGGSRSETLYFNKLWAWHYDGLLHETTGRNSKHVYLGESRIVTKISRADGSFTGEERIKQYYYHSDHLGSAQVISNAEGEEYERIEYTPYGELWIEKASTASNIDIAYRFTGKERDEETGLYYYGARYLDSKASRWLSTDPAAGDYVPGAPVDDEARKRNQSLPGQGGVFNVVNLHLYHYAGNNPVKYTDPDGRTPKTIFEKQIESVTKAIVFLSQNKDAIQKTGIGAAKVAMGLGISTLGVGGGAGIAIGSGGTAALVGVALADAAIVAGGAYVGAGVADVLDGIVMMSQSNGNGGGHVENKPTSAGQMNQQIKRGQSPHSTTSADVPRTPNEKPHVHFENGQALNNDGTWKHGGRSLTNAEKQWLKQNNWQLPEE